MQHQLWDVPRWDEGLAQDGTVTIPCPEATRGIRVGQL